MAGFLSLGFLLSLVLEGKGWSRGSPAGPLLAQ